ncbi:MAG: hypothetical protein J6X62_03595 [Bacteroidales bacterium]|nr:hypothetical protein [Bacteroidales bacterium]
MHASSITPHKRSAVWGAVMPSSTCVPGARALEPSLISSEATTTYVTLQRVVMH